MMYKVKYITESMLLHCTCNQGHILPTKYWREDCPICKLIYRAEVALDEGEWAYLDTRRKFEEALNEIKKWKE
jgi:hypothetical protein